MYVSTLTQNQVDMKHRLKTTQITGSSFIQATKGLRWLEREELVGGNTFLVI